MEDLSTHVDNRPEAFRHSAGRFDMHVRKACNF